MKTITDKRKRVVIYVRVSSHEQVEDGNSLITQERLCREFCEKHNFEVVIVYIERGESAKTANRTELKKLLEFCSNKKNEIYGLIIYKIDRLSRNTDDYSQLRILMRKYQVEIISITEKFEDTPVGRFIENTMSNVSQFDNDIRTERSVNGMKQSILEGRYTFRPPVGYKRIKVDKKNDIAPGEKAKFIIRIFELANKGFGTLEDVRQQVIKEGFVLDTGKPPCKQHFYNILRDKLYIGIIEKFGEERPGLFEPVLKNKQLFWEVQKVLKNNGIKSKTRELDNPLFPLRRFIFKPDMSKPITGGITTTKYGRYPKYNFPGKNENSGILNTELHKLFSAFMDEYAIPKTHLKKLKTILYTKFNTATVDQRKNIGKASDKLKELQEKEKPLLKF
jgi:DNA invertase Pin-like site-specific DNA recombinase